MVVVIITPWLTRTYLNKPTTSRVVEKYNLVLPFITLNKIFHGSQHSEAIFYYYSQVHQATQVQPFPRQVGMPTIMGWIEITAYATESREVRWCHQELPTGCFWRNKESAGWCGRGQSWANYKKCRKTSSNTVSHDLNLLYTVNRNTHTWSINRFDIYFIDVCVCSLYFDVFARRNFQQGVHSKDNISRHCSHFSSLSASCR